MTPAELAVLRAAAKTADPYAEPFPHDTGDRERLMSANPLETVLRPIAKERDWLLNALIHTTGTTEAEVRECMAAPDYKPVLNRHLGAELRKRFEAEDECNRLRALLDGYIQQCATEKAGRDRLAAELSALRESMREVEEDRDIARKAARDVWARIAELKTAASNVVVEWAMAVGPDACPCCGFEDGSHLGGENGPCPVGVLDEVTRSIGVLMPSDPIHNWRLIRVVSRSLGRKYVGCIQYERDNELVNTSPITAIDGNTVTTRSGSVYVLAGNAKAELEATPFHLTDGTPYPPGATVDPVPPEQGATLAELTAFYGDRMLVGLYDDGDYCVFSTTMKDWAVKYVGARSGRLYLNGVEVTE